MPPKPNVPKNMILQEIRKSFIETHKSKLDPNNKVIIDKHTKPFGASTTIAKLNKKIEQIKIKIEDINKKRLMVLEKVKKTKSNFNDELKKALLDSKIKSKGTRRTVLNNYNERINKVLFDKIKLECDIEVIKQQKIMMSRLSEMGLGKQKCEEYFKALNTLGKYLLDSKEMSLVPELRRVTYYKQILTEMTNKMQKTRNIKELYDEFGKIIDDFKLKERIVISQKSDLN